MKLLLVFILSCAATLAGANSRFPKAWLEAEFTDVSLGQHSYPLVHLKRTGRVPVILLHGYGANEHCYMDLGSELYERGHDVWVFRWAVENNRNVGESAETVKEIVDHVSRKTGKRVVLVGHSMGGIISKLYAYGLVKTSAGHTLSADRRAEVAKKVRALVSVASPNGLHVKKNAMMEKIFSKPMKMPYKPKDLTAIIRAGKIDGESLTMDALEFALLSNHLPHMNYVMKGVMNANNHSPTEYTLSRIYLYTGGAISAAVQAQIQAGHHMQTADAKVNYTETFLKAPRTVHMSFVAGEGDAMALKKGIEDEALAQKSPVVVLPDAGHIDPLFGKRMPETADAIEAVIR